MNTLFVDGDFRIAEGYRCYLVYRGDECRASFLSIKNARPYIKRQKGVRA